MARRGHAAAIMQQLRGWRPYCVCGWQSPNLWMTERAAEMEALNHERTPTQEESNGG